MWHGLMNCLTSEYQWYMGNKELSNGRSWNWEFSATHFSNYLYHAMKQTIRNGLDSYN
jgi:hypothetical protein